MKKYFAVSLVALAAGFAFAGENEEAAVNAAAKVGESIGGKSAQARIALPSQVQSAVQKANLTISKSGVKDAVSPPEVAPAKAPEKKKRSLTGLMHLAPLAVAGTFIAVMLTQGWAAMAPIAAPLAAVLIPAMLLILYAVKKR